MFNAKHFALSFAALAACTTEPAVELAPQQSADALAAAVNIGILTPIASASDWTVYAQPMGIADDNMGDKPDEHDTIHDPQPDDNSAEEPASSEEPAAPEAGEEEQPEENKAEPETKEDEHETIRDEPGEDNGGTGGVAPGTGHDPSESGTGEDPIVFEGTYAAFIVDIFEEGFELQEGESQPLVITVDSGAYVADGFVNIERGTMPSTINEFTGSGTATFIEDSTGCEVEWSRDIEGAMGSEGKAKMTVFDTVTYADPGCAGVDPGEATRTAGYRVELSRD